MKTYICGHRNPDTDSIASAYALADLRRRGGMENVEAICAGRLPPKAKWVFNHFGIDPVKRQASSLSAIRVFRPTERPFRNSSAALPFVITGTSISWPGFQSHETPIWIIFSRVQKLW